MKSLRFAGVVLAITVLFCAVNAAILSRFLGKIDESLITLPPWSFQYDHLTESELASVDEKLRHTAREWEAFTPYLLFTVKQSKCRAFAESLAETRVYFKDEDYGQYAALLMQTKALIKAMREEERLHWGNIL